MNNASAPTPDMLAEFHRMREELRRERELLLAQVRDIDVALGESTKAPATPRAAQRPRVAAHGSRAASVRDFLAANPGATSRQIRTSLGYFNQGVIASLKKTGQVRSEGSWPSMRYYLVNGNAEAAQ